MIAHVSRLARVHRRDEGRQRGPLVVGDSAEAGQVDRQQAETGRDRDTEERPGESGARPHREPVREVEDDEHDGRGADEGHEQPGLALEQGRQHEPHHDEAAEDETDEGEHPAPSCDDRHDEEEEREHEGQGSAALHLEEGVRLGLGVLGRGPQEHDGVALAQPRRGDRGGHRDRHDRTDVTRGGGRLLEPGR